MKRLKMLNSKGDGEFDTKEQYHLRLKYLAGQIRKSNRAGRKISRRDMKMKMLNEKNTFRDHQKHLEALEKLNKDVAVIVPTVFRHMPWLRACLTSLRKIGYYILIGYDNHFYHVKKIEAMYPDPEVMAMGDAVVTKHMTHFVSVGISYMWNMLYGLYLLKEWGFPYVFSHAGDCVMEKPEGFPVLLEMLQDYDVVSCEYRPERKYCGTLGVITKTSIWVDFFEQMVVKMYMEDGNAEQRLYKYAQKNNLTVAPVKNPEFPNFKLPDPESDWGNIVGFRHLHAEQKIRRRDKMPPVEKRHVDYGRGNINIGKGHLFHYYETGNDKLLEGWWG